MTETPTSQDWANNYVYNNPDTSDYVMIEYTDVDEPPDGIERMRIIAIGKLSFMLTVIENAIFAQWLTMTVPSLPMGGHPLDQSREALLSIRRLEHYAEEGDPFSVVWSPDNELIINFVLTTHKTVDEAMSEWGVLVERMVKGRIGGIRPLDWDKDLFQPFERGTKFLTLESNSQWDTKMGSPN